MFACPAAAAGTRLAVLNACMHAEDSDSSEGRKDDEDGITVQVQPSCLRADVGSTAAAAISTALSRAWQAVAKKNSDALVGLEQRERAEPLTSAALGARQGAR